MYESNFYLSLKNFSTWAAWGGEGESRQFLLSWNLLTGLCLCDVSYPVPRPRMRLMLWVWEMLGQNAKDTNTMKMCKYSLKTEDMPKAFLDHVRSLWRFRDSQAVYGTPLTPIKEGICLRVTISKYNDWMNEWMNEWKCEKTNKKIRHNEFLSSPFSLTPRSHGLLALIEHQNHHRNSSKHHVPIICHHP